MSKKPRTTLPPTEDEPEFPRFADLTGDTLTSYITSLVGAGATASAKYQKGLHIDLCKCLQIALKLTLDTDEWLWQGKALNTVPKREDDDKTILLAVLKSHFGQDRHDDARRYRRALAPYIEDSPEDVFGYLRNDGGVAGLERRTERDLYRVVTEPGTYTLCASGGRRLSIAPEEGTYRVIVERR